MENLQAKLYGETARIPWKELQLFFARGVAVYVCPSLDLVEIATGLSNDDVDEFQRLMISGRIARVSDGQAALWHDNDSSVWAVVVKPWVLVQPITEAGNTSLN